MSPEYKEKLSVTPGVLLVLTGRTGAGKDYLFQQALNHPKLLEQNFTRIVTCTSRPARAGEQEGVDYHFISQEEIFAMHKSGELVEDPVLYGTTYKATPISEIKKVLEGENKIWRIDPNLAGEVASGDFFERLGIDSRVKEKTVVIFIDADRDTIVQRRMDRDQERYNPDEYKERDLYDDQILEKYTDVFTNKIDNPDGDNTSIDKIISIVEKLT